MMEHKSLLFHTKFSTVSNYNLVEMGQNALTTGVSEIKSIYAELVANYPISATLIES